MLSKRPNRFKNNPYVEVSRLPGSFLAAVLPLLLIVCSVSFFCLFFTIFNDFSSSSASAIRITPAGTVSSPLPSPSPIFTPTFIITDTPTPLPTWTPIPTQTPLPTWTPIPTQTPLPTFTPWPTELPTATPGYAQIVRGDIPVVRSDYAYGFYQAYCLSGPARLEPRVLTLDQSIEGLYWRLWNDYGYSDELEYLADTTTFYLSDAPSVFYVALWFYDVQKSDIVTIDYPGDCSAVRLLFVPTSLPSAHNVVGESGSVSVITSSVTVR